MSIQEITDTSMLPDNLDEHGEPNQPREAMTATVEPDPKAKIEFHVQMRSWTQSDMEDLIVEAAARQIIGRVADNKLAKMIKERCMALVTEKIDAHLSKITDAIIDQPLTPSFGDKKPVTMREFIGLYPREYLAQTVDRDGKPCQPSSWNDHKSRHQVMVEKFMDAKFKREIEQATNTAIVEIQNVIRNRHAAIIAAEKQRLAEALAKAVAP
ncbi:hypothetical protein ACETRX_04080 [Labrys portucalensis]|uniref:DUF3102 domain-containing protein n=1 Tax=Labrys neptuniae TaxID=376174 RepID=A0ABV6Z9E2_9HYPH